MNWPVDLGAAVVGTDSSLYMTGLCCPELRVALADRMATLQVPLLPSRMVEDGHGVGIKQITLCGHEQVALTCLNHHFLIHKLVMISIPHRSLGRIKRVSQCKTW